MNRPPINEAVGKAERCKPYNGHVGQIIGPWLYPCLGCGVEQQTPLWWLPCPTPYTDPVAVAAMLTEIRDEARAQTAILHAIAEKVGIDPARLPGMSREKCDRLIESPFGNARCQRQGGHPGPCMGDLK